MRQIAKWSIVSIAGIAALLVISPWIFPGNRFLPRSGCPIWASVLPLDRSEIRPEDYLEWRVLPGLSTWIPFRLRIFGDGRVERETVVTIGGFKDGCPLHTADQTDRIPAADARRLLSEARDQGFCRLCGTYYDHGVTDLGSSKLTVSLNRKVKVVRESSIQLPPLFIELTKSAFTLAKMDNLVNIGKFSPERSAECRAFMEDQEHRNEKKDP